MTCRFVVMSDTHFIAPPADQEGTWWNRTTHRFSREMGEALVETVTGLSPDFAVHCGDFTGMDTRKNYEFGVEFMDQLGCPWFGVPGNHDTWSYETREGFSKTFGCSEGKWSYSCEIPGLKFFFLDVVHWYSENGECSPFFDREKYDSGKITGMGPSEKDLIWLEKELEKTHLPAVIVSHAPAAFKESYPLKTLPYGKPVKAPMTPPSGFINDIIGREKLYRLTQKYPVVKVCFAGHWHINDALTFGGVLYVQTGCLREFPYEIRLVEYSEGRFRITTHGLKVQELREISYIKEWGNRWVEGEPDVREFVFSY